MDKLFKSIDVLCDYVRNINNNTKGKNERYYIVDQIIDIQKQVAEMLNNISGHKHENDSFSIQASKDQLFGYFDELIHTLQAKSKDVKDLTLSQFLSQVSIDLNIWRKSGFKKEKSFLVFN